MAIADMSHVLIRKVNCGSETAYICLEWKCRRTAIADRLCGPLCNVSYRSRTPYVCSGYKCKSIERADKLYSFLCKVSCKWNTLHAVIIVNGNGRQMMSERGLDMDMAIGFWGCLCCKLRKIYMLCEHFMYTILSPVLSPRHFALPLVTLVTPVLSPFTMASTRVLFPAMTSSGSGESALVHLDCASWHCF